MEVRSPFIAVLAALATLTACSRDEGPSRHAAAAAQSNTAPANSAPAMKASPAARATASVAMREMPDFSALVQRYGDAVVNVRITGHAARGDGDQALLDFFHRGGEPAPSIVHGTGSGFIVTPDGYILTNAHVVSQADEVTVKLTDRREFPAKVVGADTRTDVAVIKIDARNLPVVRIGDDRQLKTGQWVLAIGAPFGLENTATAGIVSGTARSVSGETPVPFIQTDVAVNPGNSGGPLFNLEGEVVGINSMIFSQSGGYMGISFAVPIEVAMEVRDQLVKTGHVTRGRIGVIAQDVDAALASSFQLDRPRGALVSDVEEDGPAARAGVKAGDVVLEVSGQPIEQSAELSGAVAKIAPGQDAQLVVWRGGQRKTLTARVDKLEEPEERQARTQSPGNDAEDSKLGLVVRALTAREKQSVETDGNVVVADVQGSAARAGVQRGDIIIAVNDRNVKSVKDLRAVAARLRNGDAAALLVQRDGVQIFVPVRAGQG